jgi:hypothetical protein
MKKQYRRFESARDLATSLVLKNQKEWKEYCRSGDKPDDIPAAPEQVYKNKGWKGYGDWLGTGNESDKYKLSKPFIDARIFVQKLGLKNSRKWKEYCRSGDKPDDIPTNPNTSYKNDWKGWGDWLGTGAVGHTGIQYRTFKEAKGFVITLKFNDKREWEKYCASGDKPDDIPSVPNKVYKKEWKGYGDWLGTGRIATINRIYRPFAEAREFVRSLGLNSLAEWKKYCASGDKPDDIPSSPWDVYKEWKQK